MMIGFFIGIWVTPVMTLGHFLFAMILTLFVSTELYYYIEPSTLIKIDDSDMIGRRIGTDSMLHWQPVNFTVTEKDYYSGHAENLMRQKHPYRYHENISFLDGMTLLNVDFDYNKIYCPNHEIETYMKVSKE